MEAISLGQIVEALVISGVIASIAVLFIQTALEDHRIIVVLLTAPFVLHAMTTPGTNGYVLVRSLFALAVLFLVAAAAFRNIRRPRVWGPLLGSALGIVIFFALYGDQPLGGT